MEEFGNTGCVKQASKNIIQTMFIPGMVSIVTDALGISLVALAAIPALVNIAIVCSFWFLATTIMAMIMTPIVLSYIPSSERFIQQTSMVMHEGTSDYRYRFLNLLGNWIPKRGKWYVAVATIVLTAVGWVYAEKIQIGDFFPGSSILWPFHRYNKDAFRITFSMPLLNPLYVILEGETGQFVTKGETLREMDKFQRYISKHERVMFAYSIANNLPGFLMASYEDDPQWCHLPKESRVLSFLARQMVYAGEPGTWDRYIDMGDQHANIVIYCRDKMPTTVESVISYIKEYMQKTPGPPGGKYILAGGPVGVQAAVREVIADSQVMNLILALGGVFIFCSFTFRSLMAGFLLTVPLAISNVLTFALMGAYHIGLTVNTYPVSSVGIGIGVDYGIYYLGRLLEEREKGFDLPAMIRNALTTNGRSIIQIATTLTLGLGLWVLSPLKFQAEMGALLAILLLLNMLGALLLVPSMICIFKPSFITKGKKGF